MEHIEFMHSEKGQKPFITQSLRGLEFAEKSLVHSLELFTKNTSSILWKDNCEDLVIIVKVLSRELSEWIES